MAWFPGGDEAEVDVPQISLVEAMAVGVVPLVPVLDVEGVVGADHIEVGEGREQTGMLHRFSDFLTGIHLRPAV